MIVTRLETDQSLKGRGERMETHANMLVEPPVPVPTQRVDRVIYLSI